MKDDTIPDFRLPRNEDLERQFYLSVIEWKKSQQLEKVGQARWEFYNWSEPLPTQQEKFKSLIELYKKHR